MDSGTSESAAGCVEATQVLPPRPDHMLCYFLLLGRDERATLAVGVVCVHHEPVRSLPQRFRGIGIEGVDSDVAAGVEPPTRAEHHEWAALGVLVEPHLATAPLSTRGFMSDPESCGPNGTKPRTASG